MTSERHPNVWGEESPASEEEYREASAEIELAAAVLRQAFDDLQRNRSAIEVRRRRQFRDAWVWVASDAREWPFSFLNVCEMLDLSPEALRTKLLVES